jgi:hypothetical protein
VIPIECRQRGHVMRVVSQEPRRIACAREGCPIAHTIEVKFVAVPADLAHILACPHHSDEEKETARQKIFQLAENVPTQTQILDAAVEDFATEIPEIEAFANGESK